MNANTGIDMDRILRGLKNKQLRQMDALTETNNHIQLIENQILEQQKQKVLEMENAAKPAGTKK